MKRRLFVIAGAIIPLALALIAANRSFLTQTDFAKIRAATARFHRPEAARAAGYDLVPGLDSCFNNPGVGGMGFHYIDANALDTQLDLLHPEAMVYAPGPNGTLELGAVEYIVPQDKWEAAGNTEPPKLKGMSLHLDEDDNLPVYVLHAWVWKNNPSGILEDWNPKVSCP
ncbi:MAG TPA: hypothetical protein VK249_17675 [Anaerolineales bacterium]|nr:hypothetical protein [Anaerolineales bacterium]